VSAHPHHTTPRRTDFATDHIRLTMWQKLKRFDFLLLTRKEMRLLALIALALIAVLLWMLFYVVSPPPPKVIRMSTGSETGAYYRFGKAYAERFKQHGITLEVVTSNGTLENLARLNDTSGDKKKRIDLAFVQGGVADAEQFPKLESLASVAYEPVWMFYSRTAFPKGLSQLSDLAGKRVAVGVAGSGGRAVAVEFLKLNNINESNATLSLLNGMDAVNAVDAGTVDAMFLVAATEAQSVQAAIEKNLGLMSFKQAEAYARKFPWAAKITLPKGGANMARNLPAEDVDLVAATANLVARADLHHSIMFLALDIASDVHRVPNAFAAVGDWTSRRAMNPSASLNQAGHFCSAMCRSGWPT
jgi:uncharacterized protein